MFTEPLEKRYEKRIKRCFGVSYLSFPEDGEYIYGDYSKVKTCDASSKGLCFIDSSKTPISINAEVALEICVHEEDEFYGAVGRIRWKKRAGDKVYIGVEIIEMQDRHKYVKDIKRPERVIL